MSALTADSFHVAPPDIPAGMTVSEYRRARPDPQEEIAVRTPHRVPVLTLIVSVLATVVAGMAFASAPASATSATYTNSTPITIPDSGEASPSPSQIEVQGQPGVITEVSVSLRGVSHVNPADLDVLLVSPAGDASVVMSDSCYPQLASTVRTWFFRETLVGGPMPAGGDRECTELIYRPTNHATGDSWADAPVATPIASFDRFIGENPNGAWRLYVVDDRDHFSGKIAQGWSLTLETEDPDVTVPGPGQGGLASRYPITKTVSGVDGVIADVDVSLSGVFHQRPDDIDMLLVGPRGQQLVLMSDSCGASAAKRANWGWNDEVAGVMSDNTPCPSGLSYLPTDHEHGETLPGPAPSGPYDPALLSVFDHTDPNGDWRLYVYDDQPADADGFFVERFGLHIETRPRAKVAFAEHAVDVAEGETRELTLTRSGSALGAGTVSITSSPRSADAGTDYRPVSTTVDFAPGQTEKTVSVEALADSDREQAETFALTIGQPTGDADPATPPATVVTIRDRTPRPGGGPGGGGPGPGGGPAGDRRAPVIASFSLSPRQFAVSLRATVRSAARRGTRIRYRLSEPATVMLRFQRKQGHRYVKVGSLRRSGRSGQNRVAFSGQIGRRALRRGAYRLVIRAVDGAGNRSKPRVRRFRIVR